MNIAFVTRSERDFLNSLYLRHVRKSSAELIEAGHQVLVLINKGPLLEECEFPAGVEVIEIEFQDASWESRYHSEAQAISDQFLLAVSEVNKTAKLDVIEFPLWGGLGFSTIRCKRLLGCCKKTRIVTNAVFAHTLWEEMDEQFFPDKEFEIVTELESYVLRYADLICSPFEFMGEKLRLKLGRSDIKYYDPSQLRDFFAQTASPDKFATVLKSLVADCENKLSPMSVEEIFQQPGRKHFSKKDTRALVSVVTPFQAAVTPLEQLMDLSAFADGNKIEFVYYCPTEDKDEQKAFAAFSPEKGRKHESIGQLPSVTKVLNNCKGEYVVFSTAHLDLNADYLGAAVPALENNPELAYVGSYLGGGIKYPIGYVPTLMPMINTCAFFGNVFRKRSLLQGIADAEIAFESGTEWEIMIELHQHYLTGDILPHTFLSLSPELIESGLVVASKFKAMMMRQKQSLAAQTTRILKLLISCPDLLTQQGPEIVESIDEDWEFRVPEEHESSEAVPPVDRDALAEVEITDIEMPVFGESLEKMELHTEEPVLEEASSADTIDFPESVPDADEEVEEPEIAVQEIESEDEPLADSIEIPASEPVIEGETEENEAEEYGIKDTRRHSIDKQTEPEEVSSDKIDFPESEQETEEFGMKDTRRRSLEKDAGPVDTESEETESADELSADGLEVPESVSPMDDEIEDEGFVSDLREIEEEMEDQLPVASEDETGNGLDWFQVFWAKDNSFKEVDSITEPYQEGNKLFLEFAIDAAQDVNTIRLDPCNRPGVISIRKIEILDNESELVVFSASEDNAFDNILPNGDFEVAGIEQDALILKSTGGDPQLIIHLKHTIIRNFTLTMRYDYKRSN